ncbi:hypothetical protein VTK26DRAFT_8782 [Humicola hyalothermophila]
MPSETHHRRRSSIDQVIDLLADLEESQIALLLDDFNHTTPSNVPVSEAIALFEQHAARNKRKSDRPTSPVPVMTLQAELERRHSKRISSAPDPWLRARPATRSYSPPRQQIAASPEPTPVPAAAPAPEQLDRLDPPPLVSSRPVHPETSNGPPSASRPRSYKRISRPMILSPTATAELHHLLRAFFNDASTSSTPSPTPSPTTPNTGTFLSPFSPFSPFEPEPEPFCPGLDLLEPSPTRTPSFSGRSIRTTTSMSSIFEVLRSQ